MLLPKAKTKLHPGKVQVIEFKGYDCQSLIDDGQMREMKNLTSDEYPCIYQRRQRGMYSETYANPANIMTRKEKLCVVDGRRFYYDGQLRGMLDLDGEKHIAAINTKICIFPDKKYYDTTNGKFSSLECTASSSGTATITKNSITMPGVDVSGFSRGDAVSVTGFEVMTENNTPEDADASVFIEKVDAENCKLTFGENSFALNSTTVESYDETGTITIARKVPDIDFVIEQNNRLWGCKGNAIYACKQGDPLNWNYFKGVSTDSYAVEVGTDGDFTGCVPYSSHLLFFKENYIHKLYGNKPANYQIITANCLGMESGSHRSSVIVNDIAYYKSREGIMQYAGDLPALMTHNFGTTRYENAVGGTDGLKYYVSMRNRTDGKWYMFAYDIARNMWHIEDNTHASCFAFMNDRLLFVDADTGRILTTSYEEEPIPADKKIEWMAVLGDYDEFKENKKVYSKLDMRLKMEEDSELDISISVDNGDWEILRHIYTSKKRSVSLPIIPRRCDKFKIKLEGKGYCKIESVSRTVREGTMK
jgi:hypothetical protein